MARPKKNPDEKIKKAIPVKFSNTDIIRIKEASRRERVPVSTFIRKVVLDKLNGMA